MLLFIYFCILILNVIAVFLTYRFLGTETEKKEKWIFVAVCIAIMYLLVTFVYWISTNDINLGDASSTAQNLITFVFVPVNSILILPFFASSYHNLKLGRLKTYKFKNRCILLGIVLFVILLIEFFYFKDIQNGILKMMQAQQ